MRPASHKEIGWYPVLPTAACAAVPWLHDLFKEGPVVFHWHGDAFDVPPGGVDLLHSAANGHQAFTIGSRVVALQFHLETTADGLQAMLAHCGSDLDGSPYAQTATTLEAGLPHVEAAQKRMAAILAQWLGTGA